jgi:rod shape-determining protein MreB
MSATNDVVHVGIDLGTSRSSIATSTGERHVIDSYVGWPLDMVARKVVKKPVLVGHEALENRTMLDLRRPLERGLIKDGSEKDEAAVRELLRQLLALAGIKVEDMERPQIRAVVGVPAEAMRVNKQHLRNAMQGIADRLMIVSEPFAVAYGLEALLHAMIIDIGAGTTDFCVMNGRYPTEDDQRTLELAGDAVDAYLATLLSEHHPQAQFSVHMVREWKEKWSFVGTPTARVIVTVPVAGKPTRLDITQEMRSACEQLVPAITETMLGLLTGVDPEYQERVRHNIILAGGGSLIADLADTLQRALSEVGGGRVHTVPDPIFAGSDGGLAIAMDAADADWERLATS